MEGKLLVFMTYNLTFCGCFCATDEFEINGVKADEYDFGDKEDECPSNAPEDGGCGNMTFTTKEPTEAVLRKYKITKEEYYTIAAKLGYMLSYGRCNWCA